MGVDLLLEGQRARMRPRGVLLTTTLLLMGALAACSGDDDAGRQKEKFTVAGALAQLPTPEDEVYFTVTVADLAAVREANDLEVPDPDDTDDLAGYLMTMTGGLPEATAMVVPPAGEQTGTTSARRDLLGFSWVQADQLAALTAPPQEFTWYAFADDAEPAEDLDDLGDGVLSSRDGDDLETDIDSTPVTDGGDRLGRPLRIGVDGDQAVVSVMTDEVTAWLDGPDSQQETLADDAGLGAIAGVLDDAGAISATISRSPDDPATSIGVGWTVDDGESGFVIAYDLGDDAAAAAAVEPAEAAYDDERVAEQLDVSSIEADGRVLVVTGTQVEAVHAPYTMLLRSYELPLSF